MYRGDRVDVGLEMEQCAEQARSARFTISSATSPLSREVILAKVSANFYSDFTLIIH